MLLLDILKPCCLFMTYSNIQDLMSMPSASLFQKLLHRVELWFLIFKKFAPTIK